MILIAFLFLFHKNSLNSLGKFENGTSNSDKIIEPVSKSTELGISIGIELSLIAISAVSLILFRSSFSSERLEAFDAAHSDEIEEDVEEHIKIENSIPEL